MRVIAPPGVSLSCVLYLSLLDSITCTTQANVKLRLRISYMLAGQAIQDQVDFSGFPPGLTGSA